ncbi:MarR family transcriptional regulator [Nocardioides sp. CER19]|uniref:MarR family winged helix-turn-helix transcriptional regulator n=1 Tax=Nocardioides sp. CER19 TaxID=3038538 RepID=UPI00244BD3E2|nr:MarR family transcriptional regulator [Nocardioides sp. CER19]MDH2416268.1 MarR family transcriptional regulator [Nocardioides sp. CER19]
MAGVVPDEAPEGGWLDREQLAVWMRFAAVLELLPAALDAQLRRDAGLTHFDYYVLAMLAEAQERTLRMTDLARRTNATPPRLSHVMKRLEARGLVRRIPCPEDRRATDAQLTDVGWARLVAAAPGHVSFVRHHVIDALTPEQLTQLAAIADAVLQRVDPEGAFAELGRHETA